MTTIFEGTNTVMPKQATFAQFLNNHPTIEELLQHPYLPEILNPSISGYHPVSGHIDYSKDFENVVADQTVVIIKESERAVNNGFALAKKVRDQIKNSGIQLYKGTELSELQLSQAGVKRSRAIRSIFFEKNGEMVRIKGITTNNFSF